MRGVNLKSQMSQASLELSIWLWMTLNWLTYLHIQMLGLSAHTTVHGVGHAGHQTKGLVHVSNEFCQPNCIPRHPPPIYSFKVFVCVLVCVWWFRYTWVHAHKLMLCIFLNCSALWTPNEFQLLCAASLPPGSSVPAFWVLGLQAAAFPSLFRLQAHGPTPFYVGTRIWTQVIHYVCAASSLSHLPGRD